MKISTKIKTLFISSFLLLMQVGSKTTCCVTSPMHQNVINYTCSGNDTIKQKKKIQRLISKISNNQYSYYDMSKANPSSSYFSGTLIKELKGIRYARQIEKVINPNFNSYATITKNGRFFCLTKEDLIVIQGLYENWFTNCYTKEMDGITKSALDGSIYKWDCPW